MNSFEYKIVERRTIIGSGEDAPTKIGAMLNANGGEGWELVHVDESLFYFKRLSRR